MFLLKRSGGMSQNNVVLMYHFIQSTAPPYKNGLTQKFEGRELKIYGKVYAQSGKRTLNMTSPQDIRVYTMNQNGIKSRINKCFV